MWLGKINYIIATYLLGLVFTAACGLDSEEAMPSPDDPEGGELELVQSANASLPAVSLLEISARPTPAPEYCTPYAVCSTQSDCGVSQCTSCTQVCVNWHLDGTCCDYQYQCTSYACYAGICSNNRCFCY